MITHPMLQMREPAPVIDVTRPALPKREYTEIDVYVEEQRADPERNAALDRAVAHLASLKKPELEAPAAALHPGMKLMMRGNWDGAKWIRRAKEGVPLETGPGIEYREATPEELAEHWPEADGWIEWKGGECPVPEGSRVLLKLRGGTEEGFETTVEGEPTDWWDHFDSPGDIIAYRIAK